jgi:hypothetical protein
MTVVVGLLNKRGVALAADSLGIRWVSKSRGKPLEDAVFHSKVRELVSSPPVALATLGSSRLFGLSWESIFEKYQGYLGSSRFDFLEDYRDGLVGFLGDNRIFPFPKDDRAYFATVADEYFCSIREEVRGRMAKIEGSRGRKLKRGEVAQLLSEVVDKRHADLSLRAPLRNIPGDFPKLLKGYGDTAAKLSTRLSLKGMAINEESFRKLGEIAVFLFTKKRSFPSDLFPSIEVVVTGFGKKDKLPKICSFLLRGKVFGQLIWEEGQYHQVKGSSVKIATFGCDEDILTFLVGYNSKVTFALSEGFEEFKKDLPQSLLRLKSFRDLSAAKRRLIKDSLEKWSSRQGDILDEEKITSVMERQVAPVRKALGKASLEELAKTAEGLVDLAVFRAEFLPERERFIGGAAGVATLSKDDGFSWIKKVETPR